MEEKKIQRELMSEAEFETYLHNNVNPSIYLAATKFKSVRRAIKRGHVTPRGFLLPSRPFSNRGNTCKRGKHSRALNEEKKRIYARIIEYRKKL